MLYLATFLEELGQLFKCLVVTALLLFTQCKAVISSKQYQAYVEWILELKGFIFGRVKQNSAFYAFQTERVCLADSVNF